LKLTKRRMDFPQCGQVFIFPNLFISRENRPIERLQCGHFKVLRLARYSSAGSGFASGAYRLE
jgi:hypothetical protein